PRQSPYGAQFLATRRRTPKPSAASFCRNLLTGLNLLQFSWGSVCGPSEPFKTLVYESIEAICELAITCDDGPLALIESATGSFSRTCSSEGAERDEGIRDELHRGFGRSDHLPALKPLVGLNGRSFGHQIGDQLLGRCLVDGT